MPIIEFKSTMCKHCYKCVRNCDVKAIMVRDGKAIIMPNRCILCGECLQICPQSATVSLSDMDRIKGYIKEGIPTVISLSSSYLALLDFETPGQVNAAFKKLGFTCVRDSSEGAAVATAEYLKLLKEGKMENIISSACPSINELIEIHYPQLIPYLAPVATPAMIHARMLKKEMGDGIKVVFAGPCIAKKREARQASSKGGLDAVLTFEEIKRWMEEEHIVIRECEDIPFEGPDAKVNQMCCITGGLISAITATEEQSASGKESGKYRKFYVGGVNDCIDVCKSMLNREVKNCFIEMYACSGGCINGPVGGQEVSRFKAKLKVEGTVKREKPDLEIFRRMGEGVETRKEFKDRSRKDRIPSEEEIREILKKTGKTKPEDELNCGACGYPTCREKAIAIYQRKAELDMCIPYMHERAESLANLVMETSPNMMLVISEDMKILECSTATEKYFDRPKTEILGRKLDKFVNTDDIREVFATHKSIHSKKVTYPEHNRSTLQNIAYIAKGNLVIATFIDITREEEQARAEYQKKLETIDLAQKVIYKQMMVAQEIAGLLGETTAETKTTLTKLCRSLLDEGSESEVR